MFDNFKVILLIAAGWALFKGLSRWSAPKKPGCDDASASPAESGRGRDPGFVGYLGDRFCWHFLIATASTVLGFNVVLAVVILALAIPLKLMGVPVDLSARWPKGVLSGVKETLAEGKEGVLAQLEARARSIDGDSPLGWMRPEDADAVWGGPPEPGASLDELLAEFRAFDALPPERKLALFAPSGKGGRPIMDDAVAAALDPSVYYKVRVGRSATYSCTEEQIRMYRTFWAVDLKEGRPSAGRSAVTNITPEKAAESLDEAVALLSRMRPHERVAAIEAAQKFRRPLPESVDIPGADRDQQYYLLRLTASLDAYAGEAALDEFKTIALKEMADAEPPAEDAAWNFARSSGDASPR